uniref:Uncharacterized protein n=1 Tax=Setaria italica TaxID=4555 RepID=K3YK67_SETIT
MDGGGMSMNTRFKGGVGPTSKAGQKRAMRGRFRGVAAGSYGPHSTAAGAVPPRVDRTLLLGLGFFSPISPARRARGNRGRREGPPVGCRTGRAFVPASARPLAVLSPSFSNFHPLTFRRRIVIAGRCSCCKWC